MPVVGCVLKMLTSERSNLARQLFNILSHFTQYNEYSSSWPRGGATSYRAPKDLEEGTESGEEGVAAAEQHSATPIES